MEQTKFQMSLYGKTKQPKTWVMNNEQLTI